MILGDLGPLLGQFWSVLGIFGRSWGALGVSVFGGLGASCCDLGGVLVRSGGDLGTKLLGRSGLLLGCSSFALGRSWLARGSPWVR